jgi:type II secretory pathway component PulF
MATFAYTARDPEGNPQQGEVEAADARAARAQLVELGWYVHSMQPVKTLAEAADAPELSPADALELTTHLSQLATAEIPLASGLRALGHDMPRSRLSRAIDHLAKHLDDGVPLDRAVAMSDVRIPAYFQGLLACGLRSGNLALVLEQFLCHERMRDDLRQRMWSALAYPSTVLTLLALWIVFVSEVLVKNFEQIFNDFEVELPPITVAVIEGSKNIPWLAGLVAGVILLVLVSIRWLGRSRVVSEILTSLPLIGKMWRDRGVFEFADRLSLLLEHNVPLPQSLRLTASGLTNGSFIAAAHDSSRLAEAGLSLADCVHRVNIFPATLKPILAWGDRVSSPAEALRSAADWFRTRCDLRGDVLLVVIPPITFLFVTMVMMFTTLALTLPLVKLIESLT